MYSSCVRLIYRYIKVCITNRKSERRLFVALFLLLLRDLNIVQWDALEHPNTLFKQFPDFFGNITLHHDFLCTCQCFGHRSPCSKFRRKLLRSLFEIYVKGF